MAPLPRPLAEIVLAEKRTRVMNYIYLGAFTLLLVYCLFSYGFTRIRSLKNRGFHTVMFFLLLLSIMGWLLYHLTEVLLTYDMLKPKKD